MNPKGQPVTAPEGRGFDSTTKSGISHTHNNSGGLLSRLFGSTAQQRAVRGGGVLVVVIAAIFAVRTLQPAPKARPPAATPVSVEKVVHQSVPIYRYGFGTVRANNSVLLKSRVDGTLEKVLFKEGEEVKEGDVLAQIDPRPYQAALDLALAKKAQDEALLIKSRGDLARFETLRNNQFASQQNLEAQQAAVAQAEAIVKGDAAQVDNARVQLSYTTIRAPISGRIGLRQVDAGNMIRATDQAGLTTTQLSGFNATQIKGFSTTDLAILTTVQLTGFSSTQLSALTAPQIASLSSTDINSMTTTQLGGFLSSQIGALTTTQIAVLTTIQLGGLTTTQVKGFETTDISFLTTTQITGLTSTQLGALVTTQVAAFTSTQISSMSTTQFAALL